MSRLYCLVIGIGSLVGVLTGPVGAVDLFFIKETIAVSVFPPDTVCVKGVYFFMSNGTAVDKIPLHYPFPSDNGEEYPFFIEVKDPGTARGLPFVRQGQGIAFSVGARAGDTATVLVVYKQIVPGKCGRYILMTTALWGRPLDDSRYSVSVPKRVTLDFMSYECDSVVPAGDRLIYQFFKNKFMPDRDLTFQWTDVPAPVR
jgi:hypothetical protein